MSYIGRGIDQIDNISTLDNLSFSGSTATYNLTQNSVAFVPVSADALQIQIDGVIQANNFTISGSSLTFDFVPSASSVCNSVKHFGVGLLTQPSDGSVNIAQLGASGTKDATTFLRGDNTFATAGTTINTNADNRVITGSGTANTLNGEANLTYDGSTLTVKPGSNVHQLKLEQNNATDYWSLHADSSGGPLSFQRFTGGAETEKMRITTGGNVSIGTASNEARLDVRGSANAVSIQAHNTATSGINTTVLVAQCDQDTSNSSYLLFQCRNGGGLVMKVLDSGNIQNANNSYGSTSDERIKQDISDASSQWEDIKALKIRKFKKKKDVNRDGADNTPYHLGVVAQELEASGMNGLVEESKPQKEDVALHSDFGSIDSEGNFTEGQKVKEVKYSVLYMKSVKALQEAITKIETLEARVKTLEDA